MVNFEQATKITQDTLKVCGYGDHSKLEATIPRLDGWDFHYDVGMVSPKILLISVDHDGKVRRIWPLDYGTKFDYGPKVLP